MADKQDFIIKTNDNAGAILQIFAILNGNKRAIVNAITYENRST
jgi:hypothetical protein